MLNSKIAEVYGANDVINSTDLKKHIVNIDSRFRNTATELPSNFLYRFAHPYKNIIRMRVASVEIPQPWFTFSLAKKNIGFIVRAYDASDNIQNMNVLIAPGNYTYSELETVIQEQFDVLAQQYGIFMKITINPISKKCKIATLGCTPLPVVGGPTIDPSPFTLDFSVPGFEKRTVDWGLGYNLGFRQRQISVDYINVAISLDVYVVSPCPVDVIGDIYSLLAINDYYTVEHRTEDNYIQAMAKIIGTRSGGSIIFDSGYTTLTNDFVFPSPTDLKQVQIQLLDPYGVPLEMDCSNFSISLEITEVTNLKMYEFYRNYLWLGAIPRISSKAGGSAVAGYLPLPAGW